MTYTVSDREYFSYQYGTNQASPGTEANGGAGKGARRKDSDILREVGSSE